MTEELLFIRTRLYPPSKDDISEGFKNKSLERSPGDKTSKEGGSAKDEFKEGLMFFLANTTAHGFGHVHTAILGKNRSFVVLFSIVTLICIIAATYVSIDTTIATFFTGAIRSTIKMNLSKGGKIPKLVLCNSGFFNVSAADDLGLNKEFRAYMVASMIGVYGVTPNLIQDLPLRKRLHESFYQFLDDYGKGVTALLHDAAWKCENLITRCIHGPYIFNGTECCNAWFRPVVTFYGVCYEANMDGVPDMFMEGHTHGYKVHFKITPDMEKGDIEEDITFPTISTSSGLTASVMNNVTSSAKGIVSDAIYIRRGLQTNVALEYLLVNNIQATTGVWFWSEPTCIKLDASPEDQAKMRTNCIVAKLQKVMQTGNCSNMLFLKGDERPCTVEDHLAMEITADFHTLMEAVSDFSSCRPACFEESFKTKVSTTAVNYINADEDEAILNLYYPSFMYTEVVQSKPNLADWISDLGGQIGIFMGASIITAFECILFTLYLGLDSVKLILKKILKW